jgi:hypothetical protein
MDINALKARLQQLNQRSAKKANDIWKAKDEHEIRCLPYPHGPDPIIELHFHYEINGQSVLCPKLNFGEECVICEFCDALKSWKGPDGNDKPEGERKQDWELFKKIQPKVRLFVPMIERTKDGLHADGPKFWGISPTSANKLVEIMSDAESQEMVDATSDEGMKVLFDVNKAFDLKVSFKDKAGTPLAKGNTKTFAVVDFESKKKPTPLSKDKAEIKKVLDSIKNIRDVYPKQSSAEVKAIFDKFVGGAQPEAKPEGGMEYGANSKEAPITGGRSIDDAFGEVDESNA